MHRSDAPAPHLKRRLMSATVIMSRALYTYSCPLAQSAVDYRGKRGNYYYKGLRSCGAADSPMMNLDVWLAKPTAQNDGNCGL